MRAAYIPPDHLKRIREHLKPQTKLVIDLAVETGYRIEDILTLRVWQINLKKREVWTIEQKTGKERTVQLSEGMCDRIAAWTRPGSRFRYVFGTRRRHGKGRRKLSRATVWRDMERACKACKLDGRQYTPHSLRKVYAVNALAKKRSLVAVQRDMGHKHISTTMLYALSDRMDDLGMY